MMQISQTKEQIRDLLELQNHCELEGITLQSCNTIRAKAGTTFKEPFAARPSLSNVASSVQGGRLIAEVSFEYSAWDSSEPSERLFLVNCTFEVCYLLHDYIPSEPERLAFSRGTAVFNCWPYAREFLRDITARIGHQTPTLPLLRIIPKKAEDSQVEQISAPHHGEDARPEHS